ncbi:hypothetical protein Purlil1_12075 [Purpureocillium lilacinum]|uniref:Uncharacterized protein n=1 Tax=Purpureocillium lilacinum TaxID=33203 RepID=A0ABR0BHU6_PURLI|nr:hypothetical protein Purlil1_12075 [Purpureocillium lilacinum]
MPPVSPTASSSSGYVLLLQDAASSCGMPPVSPTTSSSSGRVLLRDAANLQDLPRRGHKSNCRCYQPRQQHTTEAVSCGRYCTARRNRAYLRPSAVRPFGEVVDLLTLPADCFVQVWLRSCTGCRQFMPDAANPFGMPPVTPLLRPALAAFYEIYVTPALKGWLQFAALLPCFVATPSSFGVIGDGHKRPPNEGCRNPATTPVASLRPLRALPQRSLVVGSYRHPAADARTARPDRNCECPAARAATAQKLYAQYRQMGAIKARHYRIIAAVDAAYVKQRQQAEDATNCKVGHNKGAAAPRKALPSEQAEKTRKGAAEAQSAPQQEGTTRKGMSPARRKRTSPAGAPAQADTEGHEL